MDLGHLKSFVALAGELHFGRAARQLNMTQPPLSRQIQKLEQELGAALFERSSHSVALTDAGRDFLPEALDILRRCAEAAEKVRRGAGSQAGQLKMGFIGASTYRYMPRLLAAAVAEFPAVEMELGEMGAAQQLEALSLGEIDIGLVREVIAPGLVRSIPVWRETLAVVLPLDNPLARRRRLRMADLVRERLVSYHPRAQYMHQMLTGIFRDEQVFPDISQQVAHAQSILALVSVGLGIGIVPQDARYASHDNIVFRPLILSNPVEAQLHLIHRRDTRNEAIGPFVELARRVGNFAADMRAER